MSFASGKVCSTPVKGSPMSAEKRHRSSSQGMDRDSRIRVFCRMCPVEVGRWSPCAEVDETRSAVRVCGESEARAFAFDAVFDVQANQRDVFARVGLPVLQEFLRGVNGTILAYGQTGSGKTYSLLHHSQQSDDAGLLLRLVSSLFMYVAEDVDHVYGVEAAAVQIYNELVDDLLHPEHESGYGHGLPVQNGGIIPGVTWVKCERPDEMLGAFERARSNIVYAETKMNKASSRSHAVFQLKITKRRRVLTPTGDDSPQSLECTHARLNVVDLAGSERVKKSGVEGTQLKEASAINRSLLAFGNVVSALASKQVHVPFRDSKLTRILDGSVGGNCKTSLLVCVSPAAPHAAETLSTLEFASRAMRVEVDARVNVGVVELTANALLADLNKNLVDEAAAEMRAELDTLRRSAREAQDRLAIQSAASEEDLRAAEGEATRWRQAAEEATEMIQQLIQERDAALERARVAEGALESEIESLMAEVEESAQRESELQHEIDEAVAHERKQSSDALQAALADCDRLLGQLAEAHTRNKTLRTQLDTSVETIACKDRELEKLQEDAAASLKQAIVREEQLRCIDKVNRLEGGSSFASSACARRRARHSTATCQADPAEACRLSLPNGCIPQKSLGLSEGIPSDENTPPCNMMRVYAAIV